MRQVALAILGLAFAAAPAHSQRGFDSMRLAMELGSVLAAEEFCSLSYKTAAVEAFIDKRVPADDMGFSSSLHTMTEGQKIQQEDMSGAQKAAHCRQISRVAKSYGFID